MKRIMLEEYSGLTGNLYLDLPSPGKHLYRGYTEDETVFYAGIVIFYPGVAEAFFQFEAAPMKYIGTLDVIGTLTNMLIVKHNLRRLQAHAEENRPETIRFLKHLGFKYEGTLRKHGILGGDEDMYAIVRED